MKSHEVTLGVYDMATGKTVYMQTGEPIVMPNLTEPLDDGGMFDPPESIDMEYAMSNSFGFAGNSASIVIRKWVSE